MKRVLFLSLVLLVAIGLTGCSYNTLTTKQQAVKGKWADIEAQLQRRADLIPNMVKIAQMAGVQEQEVFGQIATARSQLLNAQGAASPEAKTPEQRQAVIDASNSFGGTVGRLLSLQEAYPVLKSNEAFMKVQDELSGTENRLATRREDYNKSVIDYNTAIKVFPAVIEASIFGFKEESVFKADEASRQAPTVGDPSDMRKK